VSKIRKNDYKKHLLLLALILGLAVVLCGAVSAGTPLLENQSGTVSGDLYVNASEYWAQTTGGATNEVTQTNTLPPYTSIQSAKVYVNVYSGSGNNNWPVRTTTKLDGKGDGTYVTLGTEDMNIPGSADGTVYWLNDHTMRVYSDYQTWYDVTNLITSNKPTLYVKTEPMGGDGYDGRIKMLALVVAYNDGDTDKIHYWVLNGQDWTTSSSTSTFKTSNFNGQVDAAQLNTVALSSADGTYQFNSNTLTGNLIETGSYYKEHSWDVKNHITPGADSTLNYSSVGSSFKMNLATLAIREASSPQVDLAITGTVNTVPSTAVFANEANTIKITDIKNQGTDTATNIVVALYASDMVDAVATTTIPSLAGGAQTTIDMVDPTIRTTEGGTITYTVVLDPDNLITETDESNNQKNSANIPLRYNGYKGKRYWTGGSDITTQHTYDIRGDLIYYTQPASAYKAVGWTTRTETWTATDLPVPSTGTVEKALLYLSYNWDTTPGGYPNLVTTFNGNTITLGTPYRDWSNFGFYADNKYGLYVVDVTSLFIQNGDNTLTMVPGTGNTNALYPSTLAIIYTDPNMTRKMIYLNEECDELAVSQTSYGTTPEEATAYAIFNGVNTNNIKNATLHSFAGSAGPNEGNLLWNGNNLLNNAWQGASNTASALIADVKNYLSTNNQAGIQATDSGGMLALQQFLVVEYSDATPVADFTATPTTGNAPLNVQFNDASTGVINSYQWDFDNDGTTDSTQQNPTWTYTTPGTYTIKLTVTGPGGTDEETKTNYITVNTPAGQADLVVTDIKANSGAGDFMFASEANVISVTVKNQGDAASAATTVDVNIDGTTTNVDIPALEAGASHTVTVNDPTSRTAGDSVPVSATADPSNNIPEAIETNNALTVTLTVYNNGYKGKRYTKGEDLETKQTWEGKYDVVYSNGNSKYRGSGHSNWVNPYTTTWTSTDLVIPSTATVVSARLYQGYTWNAPGGIPDFIATFNGNTLSAPTHHSDTKGFGTSNYPSGLLVYDVTSYFNTAGNTLSIINGTTTGATTGLYGSYLIVIYEDPNTSTKKIWINDGADMLYSGTARSVTNEEATAYATFNSASTTNLGNAKIINILASANEANKSKFLFNGNEYTGFWNNYLSDPQIGFSTYDVTNTLQNGLNTAGLQSYIDSGNGDNMVALNSILIAAYTDVPEAPIAQFTATPLSGDAPLNVQFNDASTGVVNSYAWDFDNDGTTDSTAKDPTWTYTTPGTYTIKLTVTGPGGTDEETKTNYITVNTPAGQADVYISTTVSNPHPRVGDYITLTFKIGNKGPDTAHDVVFKYVVPSNLEFVNMTADMTPPPVYDRSTRTITWNLAQVPVGDPIIWATFRVLETGTYRINPSLSSSTLDPVLANNAPILTFTSLPLATEGGGKVETVHVKAADTKSTVPLHKTGTPLSGLVVALLSLVTGLGLSKMENMRKRI
jgi:uncharacterized repeat protein (TIGR01451 family)